MLPHGPPEPAASVTTGPAIFSVVFVARSVTVPEKVNRVLDFGLTAINHVALGIMAFV